MGWVFQKVLYPSLTWSRYTEEKVIYLTFDDGPIPELTEFVLTTLETFNALATFFCVGDNIQKHPHIFQKIIQGKHSIGNHTFNHLNGWKTPMDIYLKNTKACAKMIDRHHSIVNKKLFRPPYGRITKQQIKSIQPSHEIIMWDVLSGDFMHSLDKDICLQKSIKYTEKGSIVVFHDNLKAAEKLYYVLPKYLKHFSQKGYLFKAL